MTSTVLHKQKIAMTNLHRVVCKLMWYFLQDIADVGCHAAPVPEVKHSTSGENGMKKPGGGYDSR